MRRQSHITAKKTKSARTPIRVIGAFPFTAHIPAYVRVSAEGIAPACLVVVTAGLPLGSIAAARSFFFFVLIRLLRELRAPNLLSRLQALGPDLLLRGALASGDPSDSELGLRLVVLNYNLISNLHLASITTQLHAMVANIESMREMAIFTPSDPESHW